MSAESNRKLGYREIAADLAKRISEGEYVDGAYLPSEKDLMARYETSRTTIRRALAKVVADNLCEQVPNRGVVVRFHSRSTSVRTIAFIDGPTVALQRLYMRMSAELLKRGIHLVHIDSEAIGVDNAVQFALERGFDGAFIWTFQGFPHVGLLQEVRKQIPLVFMDHLVRGMEADLITFDYFQMAKDVVSSMAKAGRTRIAVSGMLDMLEVTHERFSGYMSAMFESNLSPHANDYVFCRTSGMRVYETELIEARLAAEDRPDAIFVLQDQCVPTVASAVMQFGLRIPEDILIGTIGDDVQVTIGGRTPISTRCLWDDFADKAIALMLARLNGDTSKPQRVIAAHVLSDQNSGDSQFEYPTLNQASMTTLSNHSPKGHKKPNEEVQ